jgi:hypothetical protein
MATKTKKKAALKPVPKPKKPAARARKPKGSQATGEAGQAWESGGFVECAADESK